MSRGGRCPYRGLQGRPDRGAAVRPVRPGRARVPAGEFGRRRRHHRHREPAQGRGDPRPSARTCRRSSSSTAAARRHADYRALIGKASDAFTPVDTAAEDPAMIIYTSGTTGPPKGALHAQRVLLGHLPGVEFPHEFFPQPGDLFWTPADWAWIGGLLDVLLPAWHYGVPVVAHRFRRFDPERGLRPDGAPQGPQRVPPADGAQAAAPGRSARRSGASRCARSAAAARRSAASCSTGAARRSA